MVSLFEGRSELAVLRQEASSSTSKQEELIVTLHTQVSEGQICRREAEEKVRVARVARIARIAEIADTWLEGCGCNRLLLLTWLWKPGVWGYAELG